MTDVCIGISQTLASPTKFQLVFSRIANTVFYCTAVNLPGLNLPESTQQTPFVDLPVPGDKIQFTPLNIKFLIDAKYYSWTEIHRWMTGVGFPERFDQYKNLTADSIRPRMGSQPTTGIRPPYSDATLIILSNKNNPMMKISFKDCFPTQLSDVNLDYQVPPEEVLIGGATFRYSFFEIERY